MQRNKVTFGLRNIHIAPIIYNETGTMAYGEIFRLPGAVSISLSPSGDSTDFYAEDSVYFSDEANQGYEGDMEIATVTEDFLTKILGVTKDAKGMLIENKDDRKSAFALGFEVQGDAEGRRVWFYNCTASRPNQDAKTMEKSKSPSSEKLSFKAMPRLTDGAVKAVVTPSADEELYNSFFEDVQEKNVVTTPTTPTI